MRSEVEAAGPGPSPSILSLHRGPHRAGSSDTSSLALAQEEQQGRTLEQFGVPLPVVNPSVWQVPVYTGSSGASFVPPFACSTGGGGACARDSYAIQTVTRMRYNVSYAIQCVVCDTNSVSYAIQCVKGVKEYFVTDGWLCFVAVYCSELFFCFIFRGW